MNTKTEQTKFFSQLRAYGIMKVLKGWDFKFSVLIFAALVIDYKYNLGFFNLNTSQDQTTYITAILAASSTLFALTITALSIILSFSSSNFVRFLHKNSLLTGILFPFWLGNGAYLATVAISVIYLIIGEKFGFIQIYLLIAILSAFFYAIISTFYLLSTIIRFGFFLSLYEKEATSNSEDAS